MNSAEPSGVRSDKVRRINMIAGFLFLCVALYSLHLATRSKPPSAPIRPELLVEQPVFDFGTVGQNETLSATMKVVNRSKHTVQFRDTIKSCSCTTAVLSSAVLQPGQSAELQLSWETRGKRGKVVDMVYLTGDISEFVPPMLVHAEVRLSATVQPHVAASLDVIEFVRGREDQRSIQFSFPRGEEIELLSAHTIDTGFRARIDKVTKCVVVEYEPSRVSPEVSASSLSVQTTSTEESWVTVPIRLRSDGSELRP